MKTNNNNNNIQTFNNNKFGDLRTLLVNNIPYFIGKDVTDRLEYQNGSRDIIRHVSLVWRRENLYSCDGRGHRARRSPSPNRARRHRRVAGPSSGRRRGSA